MSELFLYFWCYSFLGWLYESTLCSLIGERRLINRGFLLGPYCPIYGVGAILCWMLLKNSTNFFLIFGTAAVLCCAVEYSTSFCMEKIFRARWWDYSNLPFHLHGRVCLYGGIIFGAANVIVLFFIQPVLIQLIGMLSHTVLNGAALCLLLIITMDTVLTLGSWKGLNQNLKLIHDTIYEKADGTLVRLTDRFWDVPSVAEKGCGLFVRIHNWSIKLNRNELRFFHAFPSIQIPAYEEILQRLRVKEGNQSNLHEQEEEYDNSLDDGNVLSKK